MPALPPAARARGRRRDHRLHLRCDATARTRVCPTSRRCRRRPGLVADRWTLWEQLQANGATSYDREPEASLSVGSRVDARLFSSFADLRGRVLDVGCGPQRLPSYAPADAAFELVGIDPLRGVGERGFAFVRGLAEYLPFAGGSFDRVLYATVARPPARSRTQPSRGRPCAGTGRARRAMAGGAGAARATSSGCWASSHPPIGEPRGEPRRRSEGRDAGTRQGRRGTRRRPKGAVDALPLRPSHASPTSSAGSPARG